MIDKQELYKENASIYPGASVYDIDIDFELNNGKGAWVVILQRNDRCPQPVWISIKRSNGLRHNKRRFL